MEIRGCLQKIDRARSPASRSPWQVDYLSFLNTLNFLKKINKGKKFDVMKKHFKSYVCDFPGAKELRIKLMACKNAKRSGENLEE